ncbi:ATP-binding domain-containing protein [Actinoplanes sp. NPDC049265]|uniref:nuclease-related domain-containing DEAD/DEAH box helicase n=1 Tax=Actinoplanes sp. NPDC049265 TaxID=3363902 RepID=UPI00371B070E
MIPGPERFGRVQSAAETKVAKLLSQADLGEPATCFYSVHLPQHEYKRMAEIDFLIVLKDLILVLEIKGGRLSRIDGVWTFTDRYGIVHEKREGPFEQARSAMFALQHDLEQRIPGLTTSFGAIVVTPDQLLDRDLEWDPAEYIGPAAMTVAGIERALTSTATHWRRKAHHRVRDSDYRDVVALLRPDFDRVPRLSLLAASFETDYVELAREQYDMLRGSEVNDRIFCTGGAGSGKTLLAVETARRAAQSGASVLLTCRSPGVVDVMRRSLGETAVTCLPWSEARTSAPADVLVVDEAQDLLNVDDWFTLDQLVVGGLRDGRWRMFSDPNNQTDVHGEFDPQVYAEVAAGASRYQLPYNCRNTAAIVKQTQLMTKADLGVAKAGQGPAVEYDRPDTDQDTATLLDARLKRLRHEDVDPGDVVVVTLRDTVEQSSAVHSKAFTQGRLTTAREGAKPTGRGLTRLVTVRDFKGLEAPYVLIVDVDDVAAPTDRSKLYVAMTRPRISLWLAVRPKAWRQLTETPVGNRT